jgi:predicted phosphodiesterase
MEKVAVISDIHGNLTALEAVLENIRERGIDTIFCLGDLIGKGPNSRKAVERIKETCEFFLETGMILCRNHWISRRGNGIKSSLGKRH